MTITIQLPTATLDREIPGSWNECTTEQAMTLLHILQLDGPTLQQKRLSAVAYLLQLTNAEMREWELANAAEHGKDWRVVFFFEIEEIMNGIGWLLQKTEGDGGSYQLQL